MTRPTMWSKLTERPEDESVEDQLHVEPWSFRDEVAWRIQGCLAIIAFVVIMVGAVLGTALGYRFLTRFGM